MLTAKCLEYYIHKTTTTVERINQAFIFLVKSVHLFEKQGEKKMLKRDTSKNYIQPDFYLGSDGIEKKDVSRKSKNQAWHMCMSVCRL